MTTSPSGAFEGVAPVGLDPVAAARRGWDEMADDYQAEHGDFLGASRFIWSPEGWDEAAVGLLGPVAGLRVIEVGGGAAQCARWLSTQGAHAVSFDLSGGQLAHARHLNDQTGIRTPLVQADAAALPFANESFDVACSAFGAIAFTPGLEAVQLEIARVLRPGGRWVYSTTHPVRWAFPDVPDASGLTAVRSYFDRAPYVERDEVGVPNYVEYHHTIGDHVRSVVGAGLIVDALLEPGWPEDQDAEWGQWSPLRGQYLPGTLIVCAHKPD